MKKLKHLGSIEEFVSAVLVVIMTTLTVVNVFSRYVLKASISFTDEFTILFFVLLSLMGAAIATKRKAHLSLTIITEFIPQKYHKWIELYGSILGAIFCIIAVYYGVLMVIDEYIGKQITIGMGWPEWIFGSFVPIGCAFIGFRFIQTGIKAILPKKEEDENK